MELELADLEADASEAHLAAATATGKATDVAAFERAPGQEAVLSRSAGKPSCSAAQIAADSAPSFLYTLIQTARLNDVDPQAWLADALPRIAAHLATRLDQLLP